MALVLTKEDRTQINMFRRIGVLQEIESHRIDDTSNGTMVVNCSDGDQIDDLFNHHKRMCAHNDQGHHRHHLLALNGGAKLIAQKSPLRIGDEDTILLGHIHAARIMKSIDTVILYAHAPCGAAYAHRLPFESVLDLLFTGKERVKEEEPGIKVACFCHIDYGKKKRTYFASREEWLRWQTTIPVPSIKATFDAL